MGEYNSTIVYELLLVVWLLVGFIQIGNLRLNA